jgi:hypothetical protein
MRRLRCPKCHNFSMRRIGRSGFLQEKIFPMFGYYPWECTKCKLEKLLRHRGPRKSSRTHQK